jgi:vancomycin aglycone glucosyltransferase
LTRGRLLQRESLPVEKLLTIAPAGGASQRSISGAGELVAAQFDTVAAVAEGCDALVATGVTPAGVWR